MKEFLIVFPNKNVEVKAVLLEDQAPKTCEGFWELLREPIKTLGTHAMYTGREISTQMPPEMCKVIFSGEFAQENITCFPLPGDLLFTFMPIYSFGGNPSELYDIGIFYGRDARTFLSMGWVPGNLFARIMNENDRQRLEEIGKDIHVNGQQTVIFKRIL